MRTIDRSSLFKRDFRRELKGRYRKALDSDLVKIIICLAEDKPLDIQYKNHALSGNWNGYWECHIKPDLLLIYKKVNFDVLLLARIDSHSELF